MSTRTVAVALVAVGAVFLTVVVSLRSVAPVALSGAVGAFLFGVGMQLGGGCASGTLYTAGGCTGPGRWSPEPSAWLRSTSQRSR